MVLIKTNEFGHINIGNVYLVKKKSKASAFIEFYTGAKWFLFRNTYYENIINSEFPNEYYKTKNMVPIYRTFKDGVKVSNIYPRKTENGFRFLVSIHEKKNVKTMKKYNQFYYIANGFDDNYNIVRPTELTRKAKGNFSEYEGY